ncbi:MAG: ABC transporter permease [Oscillospiraceae bacterium]|jgi:ribose transport system permease protein|nr:ABC transporter permease [Oscillospiraceae bacterium]
MKDALTGAPPRYARKPLARAAARAGVNGVPVLIAVLAAVAFSVLTKSFLSGRNFSIIFREASFLGLLALAMQDVIVAGEIDLSTPAIACVSGVLCARFSAVSFAGYFMPGVLVLLFALAVGAVFGLVNALLTVRFGIRSYIATFASGLAFMGLARVFATHDNGKLSGMILSMPVKNPSFLALGRTPLRIVLFGETVQLMPVFFVWIVFTAITVVLRGRTKFGAHVAATGLNFRAANTAGVRTGIMKSLTFIIGGAVCGLAGAFYVSYATTASPDFAASYELQVITACLLGGLTLRGYRIGAVGVFFGSLAVVIVMNGLNKFNLVSYWGSAALGIMIVDAALALLIFRSVAKRINRRKAFRAGTVKTGGADING